jgi:hypothetical protein
MYMGEFIDSSKMLLYYFAPTYCTPDSKLKVMQRNYETDIFLICRFSLI